MALPIPLSREDELSLQEQIYRFIRDQILSGAYPTGLRLPSTRDLADGLQVSRTTALLSYEWLMSEGYIETRKGSGTFVCPVVSQEVTLEASQVPPPAAPTVASVPQPRPPIVVPYASSVLIHRDSPRPALDFWYGRPDARQFPIKAWRRLICERLMHPTACLTDYTAQAGDPTLRGAIAEHLATSRGFVVAPERIVITAGAQEGLSILSRLLIRDGGAVAMENPGYAAAATLFRSYGAVLHPIGVDKDGLQPEALSATRAQLVYTTPSHQFPTGAVMALSRRQALLAWADSANAYIIEDDYDSEIIYDRPPIAALSALDRSGRVIYVGSFSKSLGAGIRIGFLVLPSELVAPVVASKSLLTYGHSWLEQAALASFMLEGRFRTHLRRVRILYRARRDALIGALQRRFGAEVLITGQESGLHLIWTLPPSLPDAAQVAALAHSVGVGIYTPAMAGALDMRAGALPERRLILGYAALTPNEIELAVKKIASALAQRTRS